VGAIFNRDFSASVAVKNRFHRFFMVTRDTIANVRILVFSQIAPQAASSGLQCSF